LFDEIERGRSIKSCTTFTSAVNQRVWTLAERSDLRHPTKTTTTTIAPTLTARPPLSSSPPHVVISGASDGCGRAEAALAVAAVKERRPDDANRCSGDAESGRSIFLRPPSRLLARVTSPDAEDSDRPRPRRPLRPQRDLPRPPRLLPRSADPSLPPSHSATRIRARQQPNGTQPTHAEEYEYEDPFARPWPDRPIRVICTAIRNESLSSTTSKSKKKKQKKLPVTTVTPAATCD